MAAACASVKFTRPEGVPFLILAFRRVLASGPLCRRYSPLMHTSAKPASLRAMQPSSSQQSKWHYIMKVRTQRKTVRVLGAIWDRRWGVDVVLSQCSSADRKMHPCAFYSHCLFPAECNYGSCWQSSWPWRNSVTGWRVRGCLLSSGPIIRTLSIKLQAGPVGFDFW